MGSKKRKILKKDEQHMEESDSSEDSCSEENLNEEIQATFEGRNLEDFDVHGIKQLLEQTFVKAHIDISQLADMLINQNGIGSVLKQVSEDENEMDEVEDDDFNVVYGVTSVLNLSAFRETPCIQQIFSLLIEQAKAYGNEVSQKKLHDILNKNEKIGLLINERFINIPPAISAPMLSSLQKEIKHIKKKNSSYDFQHYIMICKTYRSKKDKGEPSSFCNDEECIFDTYADCSFEYNVEKLAVAGTWKSDDVEVTPFRKVLLFSADKLDDIIVQIKDFLQA